MEKNIKRVEVHSQSNFPMFSHSNNHLRVVPAIFSNGYGYASRSKQTSLTKKRIFQWFRDFPGNSGCLNKPPILGDWQISSRPVEAPPGSQGFDSDNFR